jgi:hypothetical protein
MRVSRAWRDIIARIQAGYGHDTGSPVEPGDLAIFCPACPQPGINLPDDWKNDERRWVIIDFLHFFTDTSTLAGCIPGVL